MKTILICIIIIMMSFMDASGRSIRELRFITPGDWSVICSTDSAFCDPSRNNINYSSSVGTEPRMYVVYDESGGSTLAQAGLVLCASDYDYNNPNSPFAEDVLYITDAMGAMQSSRQVKFTLALPYCDTSEGTTAQLKGIATPSGLCCEIYSGDDPNGVNIMSGFRCYDGGSHAGNFGVYNNYSDYPEFCVKNMPGGYALWIGNQYNKYSYCNAGFYLENQQCKWCGEYSSCATSKAGATSITQCYIPKGAACPGGSDATGSYSVIYGEDCYYTP